MTLCSNFSSSKTKKKKKAPSRKRGKSTSQVDAKATKDPKGDMTEEAKKAAAAEKRQAKRIAGWKKRVDEMESGLRKVCERFVHGGCFYVCRNGHYGNPGPLSLLDCHAAKRPFPCSNCDPFWERPSPLVRAPHRLSKPTYLATTMDLRIASLPLRLAGSDYLTSYFNEDRQYAERRLRAYARGSKWYRSNSSTTIYLPKSVFWSQPILTRVLDNLRLLRTIESLQLILCDWPHLASDDDNLFGLINGLNRLIDERHGRKKELKAKKAQQTRERKKGTYQS